MATTSRRRLPALLGRRGGTRTSLAPIVGTARLGGRTKHLVKRLQPGDIAVIDHTNVDRIAAEELISSGVAAVVNASPSSDGKYPNAGPLMLVRAGIRVVDAPEAPVFDLLRDGQQLMIDGDGAVLVGEKEVLRGRSLTVSQLETELAEQRERIDEVLAEFAMNTVEHVRQETDILTGSIDFPPTRVSFRDRHVLIVVRGERHRRDLKALRTYIRNVRPLIVAVRR